MKLNTQYKSTLILFSGKKINIHPTRELHHNLAKTFYKKSYSKFYASHYQFSYTNQKINLFILKIRYTD